MSIPFYSAARDDLYFPSRRGHFFPAGRSNSEAALCAEMARLAYCRQEPDFAFDRDQITAAVRSIGFDDCLFFEGQDPPRGEGIHAFLARHADADAAKALAVVSFRGTDAADPTDLGDNADLLFTPWAGGGKVHAGFARALGDVQENLLAALRPVAGRVLFTGHSLGAALATLLAGVWTPAALYTIGSPRVGDADFVKTLKAIESHRFVDCCDIVTTLPPALFGYEHLGEAHYIDRNRQIPPDPGSLFQNEDRLRARAEYLVEYAWRSGNVAVRDLADHSPINYVTAIP